MAEPVSSYGELERHIRTFGRFVQPKARQFAGAQRVEDMLYRRAVGIDNTREKVIQQDALIVMDDARSSPIEGGTAGECRGAFAFQRAVNHAVVEQNHRAWICTMIEFSSLRGSPIMARPDPLRITSERPISRSSPISNLKSSEYK